LISISKRDYAKLTLSEPERVKVISASQELILMEKPGMAGAVGSFFQVS
jgi:hypothetical protein